jgi:polysaccharide deacetylase family protein (PEP-CTERM system associated)
MKNIKILTFDLEDWFHLLGVESTQSPKEWSNFEYRIEKNMDYIFDILERKKLKASFFCLGWVAREFPNLVKKIDSLGHEIGTHSDLHQLVHQQSRDAFTEDLRKSITSLEDLIGKKIRMYRSPGFSITDNELWVFEELIKQGIEIDASICSRKMFNGGLVDLKCTEPSIIKTKIGQIKEFPINLFSFLGNEIVFSGGGYFRFFPYKFVKHMTIQSNYMMTYFHPRDFDVGQPIIPNLDFSTKFRAYYGINNCYNKLNQLTDDFDFMDIGSAEKMIKWSLADKIII